MKIAVLISGEYRTFPICRKTMTFLDDPRVDVYFSTWNKSIIKNERLGLDINDTITEEKVRADLGRDAVVLVEPVECFEEKLYNSKMIHRWCTGFDLIRSSGKEYDYVMVMRPDLFFNVEHFDFSIDKIFNSSFNVAWHHEGIALQDNMFSAQYSKMEELFNIVTLDIWNNQREEGDWHKWWTLQVNKVFPEISRLWGDAAFTFCRPLTKEGDNFANVVENEAIWRDAGIIKQISEFGFEGCKTIWPEEVLIAAQNRFVSGFFDKYKKRIAVLISGEYRTFDQCRKTMKFIDDPNVDVYFSTWGTSHIKNTRLGIDQFEEITEERIARVLYPKIAKSIAVNNFPAQNFPPYIFHPGLMLNRIVAGLNCVNESGISYDRIVVIRPDLFLGENQIPKDLLDRNILDNEIVGYFPSLAPANKLDDLWLMARPSTSSKLFLNPNLTLQWLDNKDIDGGESKWSDWHGWFKGRALAANLHFTDFSYNTGRIYFCRFVTSENLTVEDVVLSSDEWDKTINLDGKYSDNNKDFNKAVGPMENSVIQNVCKPPKVALIITGMLRNYDGAIPSLEIWGEADRYLVTWQSAGEQKIEDYKKKANIKEAYIIDDRDFESVYKSPFDIPPFRATYLWKQIYKNVPQEYDKYILIRPDGFYWCSSKEAVADFIQTEGPFKVNQHRHAETFGLNDHVFIMDNEGFQKLEYLFHNYLDEATRTLKCGELFEHHSMIYRSLGQQLLKEEEWGTDKDICSLKMHNAIDTLFVRDTFKILPDEEYNYALYRAVFHDTAAWCYNNYRGHYSGGLRVQEHWQK